MNYKPLPTRIYCDGVAPTKAEVYTLAAELQELCEFEHFREAVVSALKSYEYEYEYDCYYYNHSNQDYDYDYDYDLSKEEKVLALLFLAAMYSETT